MTKSTQVCVVGGGAAGYFAAIQCAALLKKYGINGCVRIFEMNREPLNKVSISGGGRCNVMHDPRKQVRDIVAGYPRGERELIGPYSKLFSPADTHDWFAKRFDMKIEEDGRVFPATNSSSTVIRALIAASDDAGVVCSCKVNVRDLTVLNSLEQEKFSARFLLTCSNRDSSSRGSQVQFYADRVIFATGSAKAGYEKLCKLGHSIIEPNPSLFSFKIDDAVLTSLAGTTIPQVRVKLLLDKQFIAAHQDLVMTNQRQRLMQTGAVLITHQGMTGPAVLRLSAFAARILAVKTYIFDMEVSWMPEFSVSTVREHLESAKAQHPQKNIVNAVPPPLGAITKRLWQCLVNKAGIIRNCRDATWISASKEDIKRLAHEICACRLQVTGRAVNKDEFVTAGGVALREVSMDKMESKIIPGLYLAGEVLDIDGVTGGYNFQSAWTTGYIAGTSCANSIIEESRIV